MRPWLGSCSPLRCWFCESALEAVRQAAVRPGGHRPCPYRSQQKPLIPIVPYLVHVSIFLVDVTLVTLFIVPVLLGCPDVFGRSLD